jgi:tryptophanyl-tRNA synthetase
MSLNRHKSIIQSSKVLDSIVAGIQPSGKIHLGNYFGVIKTFLKAQESHVWEDTGNPIKKRVLFLADLHCMTSGTSNVEKKSIEMTAMLLACGVDPTKTLIFRQSDVPIHCQFFWHTLPMFSINRMKHMTQWKQKNTLFSENLGLLSYPLLQAADILLYDGTIVPCGADQAQHIELAAEVARKINFRIRSSHQRSNEDPDLKIDPFPVPKAFTGVSISSLSNPLHKMSKSQPIQQTGSDKISKSRTDCIFLDDSPEAVQLKIFNALTDCKNVITYDPANRTAVSSLVDLLAHITGQTVNEALDHAGQANALSDIRVFKRYLAQHMTRFLDPIQRKYHSIIGDQKTIQSILTNGAQRALEISGPRFKQFQSVLFHIPEHKLDDRKVENIEL